MTVRNCYDEMLHRLLNNVNLGTQLPRLIDVSTNSGPYMDATSNCWPIRLREA